MRLNIETIELPPILDIDYLDKILEKALDIGASDIDIMSGSKIKVHVNGEIYPLTNRKITDDEARLMLDKISKGKGGESTLNKKQEFNPSYFIEINKVRHRFRVNAVPCLVRGKDGIQITIRTINNIIPPLEQIGLKKESNVYDSFSRSQGIIFVTGPTGSGKSTTLASIISSKVQEEDFSKKIITAEAPIEYVYDHLSDEDASLISQTEIGTHLQSFEMAAKSALRRAPDIILIGETRDKETSDTSIELAQTGHLVLTTLHTNGVAQSWRRLLSMYKYEEQAEKMTALIEATQMIMTQKLAKTLDGKRVAVREYLVFDNTVKEKLYNTKPENVTKELLNIIKERGNSMEQEALKLFKNEVISEKEYNIIKTSYL